jgi:opacity protein-like surface antigen
MVKYFSTLLIVMAFAAPAFAQDVPQIEIGLGYGNIGIKDIPNRHSGFASHQTINLNSWLGVDNYLGYYGLGTSQSYGKAQLIAEIFGGKVTYRNDRMAPYLVAGIGGGFLRFPQIGSGSQNSLAFRLGGGVDIPFKENFAWKVDVSRMSFHLGSLITGVNGYNSGVNLSTGIVIKISQ